jgi:chromosome segregation ATPase
LTEQLADLKARLKAVKKKLKKYKTTSQMKTEEINRLSLQISHMETYNGQPITRDTFKGLVDKIDQLRFQYFEKERELEVSKNCIKDTESSHKKVLQVKEQEAAHLNSCLDLIKREADTLRDLVDSQRRSSQAPSDSEDLSQSADALILKELINKLETDAANLRGQVLELNGQLKETKRALHQTSFELIKKEEELKALDQKNLKIQFDLRHLEGMEEENRELNQWLSALRKALQAATSLEKLKAAPKVPAVQAADSAVVADMRAQIDALFAEINQVKV